MNKSINNLRWLIEAKEVQEEKQQLKITQEAGLASEEAVSARRGKRLPGAEIGSCCYVAESIKCIL
ncbi:hypothetical protein [Oceanobacillus massiliensis]|uniref:hypothetical protein n=1 Tax=Oceanobacillus massiliensis TaxID=1465765 RepID=UPI000288CE38|nr:hypothetical protein [Oceanobacillus massiliensis]